LRDIGADARVECKGVSMSLENLSALASIISALAIVASVVYASVEIRQNTRAVHASAFQQLVNSFAEISFEIAISNEQRRSSRQLGTDESASIMTG
jgi:hypothetical protein